MWEAIIIASITTGLGIVLTFLLTRNREASDLAHKAVASTRTYFGIIETLKTVAFLQSQRLDQWERWGRDSNYAWNGLRDALKDRGIQDLPELPTMPDLHLDLRPYWAEIDLAIDHMGTKEEKHLFGGTMKASKEQ
jgi:hypothetical protein